ncbi:MAG: hypothetical protein ACETWR_19305 [Anaerolineae bacterium]
MKVDRIELDEDKLAHYGEKVLRDHLAGHRAQDRPRERLFTALRLARQRRR